MKKLPLLIMAALTFFSTVSVLAQKKTASVACGDKIKMEFSNAKEEHDISIRLEAGDKLTLRVVPTGDYLNVRAQIIDPAGGMLFPENRYQYKEPMFKLGQRSLEITTGRLSANGTYTIRLYNHWLAYRHDERGGEYSFSTICERRDGQVIGN